MNETPELRLDDMPGLLDATFPARSEGPRFLWPGDKPLAAVVAVVVEYFQPSQPVLYSGGPSVLPAPIPPGAFDFMNWTWRSYGNRIGLWRLLDVLEARNVPVSAITNARLHEVYPEITSALLKAGWNLSAAHGYIQDRSLLEFYDDLDGHRDYIKHSLQSHQAATGVTPTGWLSPAGGLLPETFSVLAANGIEWVGAFQCDDRPFSLDLGVKRLIAMPHSTDLTDYHVFTRAHLPGSAYAELVRETVDVLSEEGSSTGAGRVVVLSAHPHVMGQPSRIRHFDAVVADLQTRSDIWWATQDDIASYCRAKFESTTTSAQPT